MKPFQVYPDAEIKAEVQRTSLTYLVLCCLICTKATTGAKTPLNLTNNIHLTFSKNSHLRQHIIAIGRDCRRKFISWVMTEPPENSFVQTKKIGSFLGNKLFDLLSNFILHLKMFKTRLSTLHKFTDELGQVLGRLKMASICSRSVGAMAVKTSAPFLFKAMVSSIRTPIPWYFSGKRSSSGT